MRSAVRGMAQRIGALKADTGPMPEIEACAMDGIRPAPAPSPPARPAGMPRRRRPLPPAERVAISGYDRDHEVLAIVYEEVIDPETGEPCTPHVEVLHPGSDRATVYLDGQPVADVAGAGTLSAEDIALIPR